MSMAIMIEKIFIEKFDLLNNELLKLRRYYNKILFKKYHLCKICIRNKMRIFQEFSSLVIRSTAFHFFFSKETGCTFFRLKVSQCYI